MGSQYWCQPLVTAQVDGPTLTAAAAASMLPAQAKITLPNGYWEKIGKAWHVRATGRISSVITTPGTARFDLRIGGVVAFDSLAILLDTVAAHTNVGWILELDLTCRSIGSGAGTTLMGQGRWTCEDILGVAAAMPKADAVAVLPWNTAPVVGTGFDNTTANAVDMFFTQTVATGSMTLHQLSIIEAN